MDRVAAWSMMARELVTKFYQYANDGRKADSEIPDPTGALRAMAGAGQLTSEICAAVGEGGSVALRVGSTAARVSFATIGAATGIIFGFADIVMASSELNKGNANKKKFWNKHKLFLIRTTC